MRIIQTSSGRAYVRANSGAVIAHFKTRELADFFVDAIKKQPKRVVLRAGGTYVHIVKDGKPLCGRSAAGLGERTEFSHSTCPGCTIKSLSILAQDNNTKEAN